MRFDLFSLFPEAFDSYLNTSILQRAQVFGALEVHTHNIRDWAADRHRTTDDAPYGGGGGMVMKPEPVFASVETVLGTPPTCPVILLSPHGRLFNQTVATELAQQHQHLALICGRYEALDERICQHLATDIISIGDYVLTGGELPAMVVVDAITRLLPGVLGKPNAAEEDSHAEGLIEHPHYTRPPEFRGWTIPEVLLSGDHAEIERWRRQESLRRTLDYRPELLETAALNEEDRTFLADLGYTPKQSSPSIKSS